METEKVLQLVKPIEVGGTTYTELTLTEPTMDKLAVLINMNAKVPMAVVDMLARRDAEACDDFFGSFRLEKPEKPDDSAPT
jgi:hypothetical protein